MWQYCFDPSAQPYYIDKSGRKAVSIPFQAQTARFDLRQPYVTEQADGFIDGFARLKLTDENSHKPVQGFLSLDRQVLIPFLEVKNFSEGLAPVKREGKHQSAWGFCDRSGKMVIQPRYSDALSFSEGLAPVCKNKKWTYIHPDGTNAMPTEFDQATQFCSGLAVVTIGSKKGCIKKDGSFVVKPTWDDITSVSEGIFVASNSTNLATQLTYFDIDGKQVLTTHFTQPKTSNLTPAMIINADPIFDNYSKWDLNFHDGLALFSDQGKLGYMNKQGVRVIPAKYDFAFPFSEGRALVYQDSLPHFTFIDTKGRMILPFSFFSARSFSDGLALVQEEQVGPYMFIDKNGKQAIAKSFESARSFKGGRALIGSFFQSIECVFCAK